MDKRDRPAYRRNRSSGDTSFHLVTVMMNKEISDEIDRRIELEEDKNRSKLVEKVISENRNFLEKYHSRRPETANSGLIKKNFTFSKEITDLLKDSGNRALAICDVLNKAWKLGVYIKKD